jgi:hypothetical protein
MSQFRLDMIKLSQQYPFITKVIITQEGWRSMCKSFDKLLDEKEGHVAGHIKDKDGSMKFEQLFVEGE